MRERVRQACKFIEELRSRKMVLERGNYGKGDPNIWGVANQPLIIPRLGYTLYIIDMDLCLYWVDQKGELLLSCSLVDLEEYLPTFLVQWIQCILA